MSDKLIGVAVSGATTEQVLGRIERSDQAGIPAAWMTTGGARLPAYCDNLGLDSANLIFLDYCWAVTDYLEQLDQAT